MFRSGLTLTVFSENFGPDALILMIIIVDMSKISLIFCRRIGGMVQIDFSPSCMLYTNLL